MTTDGKIIYSKTTAGSVHDIRSGEMATTPRDADKYADLGSQGWQKESNNVHLLLKSLRMAN